MNGFLQSDQRRQVEGRVLGLRDEQRCLVGFILEGIAKMHKAQNLGNGRDEMSSVTSLADYVGQLIATTQEITTLNDLLKEEK